MTLESFTVLPLVGPLLDETWVHEPPAAQGLREATERLANRGMRIGADQGRIMHWLVGSLGATRTIEVGAEVRFRVIAKLGRWEAADIRT